jgi:hypothetical protein
MFAIAPRYGFHFHPTPLAMDSARGINKEYGNSPKWNEFELSGFQRVVPGPSVTATRTNWTAMEPGRNLDEQHPLVGKLCPLYRVINKGLELLNPIKNSLQLHPGLFSCFGYFREAIQYRIWSGCATSIFHFLIPLRETSQRISGLPTDSAEDPKI